MSYLSDFEELNGGYVAFGGNPKGDASDLVRGEVMSLHTTVLGQMTEIRELHTADHRRQIVISKMLRADHRRSTKIIELRTCNIDGDAAFDEKEPEFKGSLKFEDFSDNSINEDNAAGTLVPAVGQLSPNSTNTFSAVGPSNAATSLTHGKSSCIDTSQLPYDPNMQELEDITSSNDEDDVGGATSIQDAENLGHTQEEGIDYEEVFAPVGRIEAIRLFLAYASFMGFMVYQMDVKSAFLYGTIEKEVYVCQPLGFKDPDYPDKVYKVVKAVYGLLQAPRAWYETLANYLLENGFQRGKIDQTLFIKSQKDGKLASTPIDTEKPLLKDPDAVMSSASSVVTYTSVYTDFELGRVFWGADEELSDGGSPQVIVYRYDGLPMLLPEYIPLEDEHILPAEEQPLPPIDSPTVESPEYVTESDPKEDPEEYEEDEIEDGPDEDEEDEEEHLAPADSDVVIPTDELVSPPEGAEPLMPPPFTDTATTEARITVRLQSPTSEVERLLAMCTPSPSPLASLSPPSAGERLARCTAPTTLLAPPLPPPLHMPPPVDHRDDIPETEMPPHKSTLDAKARRQGIGEVRVTELAEHHEDDTQDLYALLEDAQDSRTRIS
nr:copia protein [Tanacetum cinerariifolium]